MAGTTSIELAEHANRIRGAIGASVQNAVVAGLELSQAKNKIPHGEWGQWLKKELGMSPRTASRFIRSANWVNQHVPNHNEVGQLMGAKGAFNMLADKNVTEEAREQAIEVMREGVYLTMNIAEGIIKAVEDAGKKAKYLEMVSDRVAALSLYHSVDPDIIPALTRIEKQMPDVFDEIEASGCISDADGESIWLSEANKRDIIDYVEHNRFETRMQKGVARAISFSKTGFRLLEIHDDYVYVQLFTVNGDGAIKDLVGKIYVKQDQRLVLEGTKWEVIDV